MNSSKPILTELKHVSHSFGKGTDESGQILSDINLTVSNDEVVALLGPSGCGKSTIMRILAGLIRPTSGEVLYRGQPLSGVNPGVAMVFQNFALYPWLTVGQNILMGLENSGLPEEEILKRLGHVMEMVGLEGYQRVFPKELSGGMKQRVGIARAMITRPEILCMDEPFSALDVLTAETLRNEIGKLCADPGSDLSSLVIVTHNISEAVFLARRIVVLSAHPGRIQVILNNDLPYPRDPDAPGFQQLVAHIHGILTQSILPDAPPGDRPAPARGATGEPRRIVLTPIPHASMVEVTGLLRLMEDNAENLFELAQRLGKEFGAVLTVVKAAEMLGLVETPQQDVVLTPLGNRFRSADVREQKEILHEQMTQLKIFELLLRMIRASEEKEVSEEALISELALLFPNEKIRQLFRTLVGWGRYAEIINYDPRRHRVRIYEKTYLGRPVRTEP